MNKTQDNINNPLRKWSDLPYVRYCITDPCSHSSKLQSTLAAGIHPSHSQTFQHFTPISSSTHRHLQPLLLVFMIICLFDDCAWVAVGMNKCWYRAVLITMWNRKPLAPFCVFIVKFRSLWVYDDSRNGPQWVLLFVTSLLLHLYDVSNTVCHQQIFPCILLFQRFFIYFQSHYTLLDTFWNQQLFPSSLPL